MRQNNERAKTKARGLLQEKTSLEHFNLTRILPSAKLEAFVEHYWVVTWDLRGKPAYLQENLPHPSQHMVIDPAQGSAIFGIHKEKFSYKLEGLGRVVGVKFYPGAFYSFYGEALDTLTNKHIPIKNVFEMDVEKIESKCLNGAENEQIITEIENILIKKEPRLLDKSKLAKTIVASIEKNKNVTSVTAVAHQFNMTVRSLERLFTTYIGVTPKWVVDRYRIIEAIDVLNAGSDNNLTGLAHELGYYDQAHFSKVFSRLVGYPPTMY